MSSVSGSLFAEQKMATKANILVSVAIIFYLNARVADAKSYVIHTDKVNWYQANINCLREGNRLGTVITAMEQDNLANLVQSTAPGETYLWTSLNDLGKSGKYVWFATGKEQSKDYQNWAPGEPMDRPGENCVALMKLGNAWTWNDDICSTMKTGYVCDVDNH